MCEGFTIERLQYNAKTGITCIEFQDPSDPADCFSEYFDFKGIDIYEVCQQIRFKLKDMEYSHITYIEQCAIEGDCQEKVVKKCKVLGLLKFNW